VKVRLVSYNIRKAVGLDWRRNPHRILGVLGALDPDIAVLQEADRRLGPRRAAISRRLIEQETDLCAADLAVNDVSLGWHGNAILVRRGLEVTAIDRIELPGLEPRGAVVARVGAGAGELIVVGLHLGLVRKWRRLQLAAIRQHLTDEEASRSVLLGDFNEWSPDAGLEPLSGDYDVVSPGKTFHASRPSAALDKFACGRRVHALAVGVDTSSGARRSSDHLPIWMEMRLRDEAAAGPARLSAS
jgi:endonuclease/exonuclease/phosphatase family metal-dependent hydrolase